MKSINKYLDIVVYARGEDLFGGIVEGDSGNLVLGVKHSDGLTFARIPHPHTAII